MTSFLRRSLLCLAWCLMLARPALAVDASRAARAMAEQGTKAYEAADFARAAQLYHDAFRTDPSRAVYLYSAARAEHVGGLLDRAVQHYRAYIAGSGADTTLVAKANGYIAEVHRAQVDAQVQEAENSARARHHSAAAQFFLAAYAADSTRHELLFKAAVAEELAGENGAAIRHYREYLAKASHEAGDRSLAEIKLGSLEKGPTPQGNAQPAPGQGDGSPTPMHTATGVQPDKVSPPAPTVSKPNEPPSRWATWSLLGGGVALIAGGAGLFLSTLSDAEALQNQLDQTSSGKISGTTHTAATTQADAINTTRGISAGLVGVGAVATGVGLWMLLKAPEKVALVPGPAPAGVGLAMRF